jgi:hypothetical protein
MNRIDSVGAADRMEPNALLRGVPEDEEDEEEQGEDDEEEGDEDERGDEDEGYSE